MTERELRESIAFQIEEKGLVCPQLEDNPLFKRLKSRIRSFFIMQEQFRRNKGPTEALANQMLRAGIDFSYRVELNRSLKRLLREVISTKDKS